MLNIQTLRRKDPQVRDALARRGTDINWEAFDTQEIERKEAQTALEALQAQRNRVAQRIAQAKREGLPINELMAEGTAINERMGALNEHTKQLIAEQNAFVLGLPNTPHPDIPNGTDETANRVVETVGHIPTQTHLGQDHIAIAKHFGGIDTAKGTELATTRFNVMTGNIARLHRALIQMMLDLHTDNGYTEVNVPYLVNEQTLRGTGQLPKFADDVFQTQDGLYLIPTAEVPVTNLVANTILDLKDLPMAFCAHTPCFRREAGSAGRDVHGLIRQHQFEKVELVRVEHPNRAEEALLTDILGGAKAVMDALELPYRVVELCTGDLGFSATHTFDIEVWLPAQQMYREISSCSNMGDFQARRMNTRLKDGQQTIIPCTLNGSGLAVGRALVALLENHIQADNTLYIPERLRPYVNNRVYLEPHKHFNDKTKPTL